MYPLNQLKTLVSCGRDPARSLPFRRGFLLIPLILLCFALSPNAQAAPAPENPDPGSVGGVLNTADGTNALHNAITGAANAAFGWFSQFSDIGGSFNTGCGAGTLALNNTDQNTAVGAVALFLNNKGTGPNTGTQNTAVGAAALLFNTGGVNDGDGSFNDAVGAQSLRLNTTGSSNNGFGNSALFANVIGSANTAIGDVALASNDSDGAGLGNSNTAVGAGALFSNVDGDSNNGVGFNALGSNSDGLFNNAIGFDAMADNLHGAGNVAVGDSAGAGVEGDFNIYIGAFAGPSPAPVAESETIRIGDSFNTGCFIGGISGATVPGGVPVIVDATGHLGTVPADSPISMSQVLKQRQIVQELKATTERQAAVIALQEGQIKALTAGLKQQADQIQKVSAQLEMVRPTPRVVENR
ncbi:MAG TPA: hypothetical protein VLQ29_03195 [Candidatus Dormibacteraeota bacterium]|nr:hypothetical protein [Candidatus Dormibacteraeota bacterium]